MGVIRLTLNSVILRSSSQDLTTTGTYIEMGPRLLDPYFSHSPSSQYADASNAELLRFEAQDEALGLARNLAA